MIKNKKAISILLVGAMLFSTIIVVMPAWASSPTIHVHSGQSIQAAVNSAVEGSTIIVHEGVYDEFVGVGKPLTLKGIKATIQQLDGNAFAMGSSGISISGFTIRSGAVAIDVGGDWQGGTITDNTIYADIIGVGINHPSNIVISNNVIHSTYPVYLFQEASNIIIQNNVLYADVNPGSIGIWMAYPKNPTIVGNTIYSNWFGVNLGRSDGAIVASNKITAAEIGIHIYGTRSLVLQNTIRGSFWSGIYLGSVWNTENDYSSSYNAVLSNTIVGDNAQSSYGVLLVEYTHDNVVAKNRISGVETAVLDKGINNIVI